MRTIVRNSGDVKTAVEKLWEDRCAFVQEQAARFPTTTVLLAVARAHGLTVEDLRGRSRLPALCMARHHAVWEMRRRRLDLAFQQIAAELNRANHATALHSWQVFCERVRRGDFAAERAAVEKELGGE